MSKDSSSLPSQTDWARVRRQRDQDIDLSDIPEITEEQVARAVLRVGRRPIQKVRVTMYLDDDLMAYFKTQAGGRGYQTLINKALRTHVLSESLEQMLRRVIREELER